MEYPFFKAFPTDWEVVMRKAGIPTAHRGNLYRLIFFAWQEGGLNLDEDESYEQRIKMLAQAFGLPLCRFAVYLRHFKRISQQDDHGRWLPKFLLEQLQYAVAATTARQKKAAPEIGNGADLQMNSNADDGLFASGAETEREQVRAEPEQNQSRTRAEPEQNQNRKTDLSPLDSICSFSKSTAKAQAKERAANGFNENEDLNLPAVAVFCEVFSKEKATIFVTTAIKAKAIEDLTAWRQALTKWQTNGYSLRNVDGMLSEYDACVKRRAKENQASDYWRRTLNARAEFNGQRGASSPTERAVQPVPTASQSVQPSVASGGSRPGNGHLAGRLDQDTKQRMVKDLSLGAHIARQKALRETANAGRPVVRVEQNENGDDLQPPF